LIAVDEKGSVITGDQILFICAHFARQQRCLNNNLVVTTVMSNIGLRQALKNANIGYAIANVGDRYVLEKMKERGADIGGEDSGHMIFLAHHTTGDGLLTALKLLEVMQATGKQLSELAQGMTVFPQVLLNVDVASKPDITTIPEIQAAIQSVEAKLKEKGRVLVRYSGTQPLCRVMVEGPDMAETETYCQKIADVVRDTIGA
jgi:phosphoglucosamine mutase